MLTLLQLQRWDALLAEPMPSGDKGLATVLGTMARGVAQLRSGRIAEELFISEQTVKNYVYGLYGKIGEHNRVRVIQLLQAHSRLLGLDTPAT